MTRRRLFRAPGLALLAAAVLLVSGCARAAGRDPGPGGAARTARGGGRAAGPAAAPTATAPPRKAAAPAPRQLVTVTAASCGATYAGYNTARRPGLGSAIFLHLNIGIATAGCVTLPESKLLPLLRWLNPARAPRIRMGVR